MSFQQNENHLYLHHAVLAWIFHLLLRERSLFMRGRMGENLKISIFFNPPDYNLSPFKKFQDAGVLFDKMYHMCLKSLVECM